MQDTYDSPDAEALLAAAEQRRAGERRDRRQTVTQSVGAVTFLVAATLLAAFAPWHRSLSVPNLVLVLAVWVVVERVTFPVAGGSTYPTMLVLVPALFILPTPVVPLVEMLANLLRRAPDLIRGRSRPAVVPVLIADSWYTIGPAVVIVLAGAQAFAWSHWPVYVGAFAAQVAFDLTATTARCAIGEGISPRVQVPLLAWVYAVDAALAPLGLVIAAVAINRPGLVLLSLSPMAVLVFFARERQHRLDQTLALSTAYRGTALLLGEVIEVDDAYTGIHSRQVVDLAISLADAIGLDSTERRNVEFTALLHDVGKIHVPKHVLNKPGQLDEEEWKIIHQHTIDGERMLRRVGGSLANVGQFVRSSHERYDGRGYPDRLAGDQIPIESRIVSVCDAYNAMITDRPYHAAMRPTDALAELRDGAGSQFDPDVVRAFEPLVAPPPSARTKPRAAPRWVRIPDGQAERALTTLATDLRRGPLEIVAR